MKRNSLFYIEHICPHCGRKKITDNTDSKEYCTHKESVREMKRKYKCEVGK